jgi:hypothetical protein
VRHAGVSLLGVIVHRQRSEITAAWSSLRQLIVADHLSVLIPSTGEAGFHGVLKLKVGGERLWVQGTVSFAGKRFRGTVCDLVGKAGRSGANK